MNATILNVTDRIQERSRGLRSTYLSRMEQARQEGPRRAHLTCGNQAHAYAAMDLDKKPLAAGKMPNLGMISAYNDMLSAHQPFEHYPELIRSAARAVGASAQMAGGVPAMCDGVTQGQVGMELSLFSRDVIAMSAAIGLSHNTFDATVYLGVCDKIVPGLVMAAATYGYLPAVFLPAGPMTSGLPNDEKSRVRQQFANGECDRDALMQAEMASYHGPGTCTFYGTANSNQMLMEFMGLHLPGASFVNPGTPLRAALTERGAQRALELSALGNEYRPVAQILDERCFVNAMVGLMATGGSTNLVLHLPAMARAAGILINPEDMAEVSTVTPLLAKVYPNGLADVNHFHAAGGLGYLIGQLLDAGLLHGDTTTVFGRGLVDYTQEPKLREGHLVWEEGAKTPLNNKILRPAHNPFQKMGGLRVLSGNLGAGVMKISAVAKERRHICAPARVFQSQEAVREAFNNNSFTTDTVIVVRFQGPKANGMPELHNLTPVLSILQERGLKVALLTDGRMSGASGKVPAAIHISPEAADGGPLARVQDGDMIELDALNGVLNVIADGFDAREPVIADLSGNGHGIGRELFDVFRNNVSPATQGAAVIL